jgi:hypothetical protein
MSANIFQIVKEALHRRLDSVLYDLLPGGRIVGKEYICASISGGRGNSCKTNLETGVGSDYSTGESWGDVIALYAVIHTINNYKSALELASHYNINLNTVNKMLDSKLVSSKTFAIDEYRPILPVPDTAPHPQQHLSSIGKASKLWDYRNKAGKLLGYRARFDDPNGKKKVLPVSFCKTREGKQQWCFKDLPEPRPLYNLPALASSSPTSPVLLVEGEKTADAAQRIFTSFVVMTWSGGSSGADKADLLPLKGRTIVIWPDNDKPGFHAALTLNNRLGDLETQGTVVWPPDILPETWDLADQTIPGFSPERYIETALPPEKFRIKAVARYPGIIPHADVAGDSPVLSLKEWPMLPPETLPGFIGEFVAVACTDSEADPAAVLVTLLVRFGVEVYGFKPDCGPYFRVGETIHPPRLFAVIVGESSRARKGTSSKPVLRLFSGEENTSEDGVVFAPYTSGPLSSGEGLACRLVSRNEEERDAAATAIPLPDKRLFILDEEFASCLRCIKREGNILSMTLRSFWDSGNYEPLTKHERVCVRGANISIVTHTTRQEVLRFLDVVQLANGFANRFLWICSRRQKIVPLPQAMSEDVFNPLYHAVQKLITQARQLREIRLTPDAAAFWESIYADISRDTTGLIGNITARSEAQCIRLALCYALLDGSDVIDVHHLQSATALWSYAECSVYYIFDNTNDNSLSNKILEILKTGKKSSSELNVELGGHIKADKLRECLQELIGFRKICSLTEQTKGRPRTIFFLAETADNGNQLSL